WLSCALSRTDGRIGSGPQEVGAQWRRYRLGVAGAASNVWQSCLPIRPERRGQEPDMWLRRYQREIGARPRGRYDRGRNRWISGWRLVPPIRWRGEPGTICFRRLRRI